MGISPRSLLTVGRRMPQQRILQVRLIKEEEQGQEYLETIIETADRNKNEVGFLRGSVYEDALAAGRLWILVSESNYCGHVLFGGVLPTLQIKQLYVIDSMRNQGLARLLVNELVSYGEREGYASIRARVAVDLEANNAWERLGFQIIKVVSGGRTTGRMINCRYRRLNPQGRQTHMLTFLDDLVNSTSLIARGMPLNRPHWYTLDINVWLDFALKREPFYEAARVLLQEASRTRFRLRFTSEAMEEAKRSAAGRESDPLMAVAQTWQAVPDARPEELEELVERLRTLIFPDRATTGRRAQNNLSDLRHVALSIRAGAAGFITREKALLAQHDVIQRDFGLQILSPIDLFEFDDPNPAPLTPLREGVKVSLLRDRWTSASQLVKELAARRVRLRPVDREDVGWVCSLVDRMVAVLYWSPSHRNDIEAFLAIDLLEEIDADSRQRTFDILAGLLVAEARSNVALHRILLRTDLDTRERHAQDLREAGFFDTADRDLFVRFVSGDPVALNDWEIAKSLVEQELGGESEWLGDRELGSVLRLRKDSLVTNFDRFTFETFFGLTALTFSGRRSYYLPIAELYANELLPRPRRPSMFQEHDASFRLERVYFRSPRFTAGLQRGDFLFFYVTKPIHALVGVARCTASEILDQQEAVERFRRLAVLDPARIGSRVHCIAFDNYICFRRGIPKEWLERRNAKPGNQFVTLAPVPDSLNCLEILREGLRSQDEAP